MDMLSTSEAARRLGLSAERIRQLADQGRLVPDLTTSVGRFWLTSTLDEFANKREAARRRDKLADPR
jgi:hypothetical protein